MEDAVVVALFGSATPTSHRCHAPQTLSVEFEHSAELVMALYEAFEANKKGFNFQDAHSFPSTAQLISNSLLAHSHFGKFDDEALGVLRWIIAAYAMVIHPESSIRLRAVPMGPNSTVGFAIFARRDIPKNTKIWEAIGMVPGDNEAVHSELSSITTTKDQNQTPGAERVLYGPIRMINHRCRSYNAEFCSVRRTSAFIAWSNRDVPLGEEITFNYGDSWFGDDCPCYDCRPVLSPEAPLLENPSASSSLVLTVIKKRGELLQKKKKEEAEDYRERQKKEIEDRKEIVRANKRARKDRNKQRKKLRVEEHSD
ncbi:hypothetical protein EST38_g13962 [Candolleomyces aberdarensis]|uniref:SET domain-containing protein n=1 Tax=Candolleomyces aberdarensis TaxID=2316362 RepID=A0A4Q2CYN5_9AGAR|nr:hypothetical protein EST38_g13962 [Candolleomyces aberdarensis]